MLLRYLAALSLPLALAACKIEITSPPEGFIISASGGVCNAGETCVVDVSDTTFSDVYFAIGLTDELIFTGWLKQPRGFCGDSTAPCALTTALFAGNESLEALVAADDSYYLEPAFTIDINNSIPAAVPLTSEGAGLARGTVSSSDDVDFFATVAPEDGQMQLQLSQLSADLDLYVLRPGSDNLLDVFGNTLGVSNRAGNANETIAIDVEKGETYFIAVTNGELAETQYRLDLSFQVTAQPTSPARIKGDYELRLRNSTVQCTNGEAFPGAIDGNVSWTLNSRGERTNTLPALSNDFGTQQPYLITHRYDDDSGTYLERLTYRQLDEDDNVVQITYQLTTGIFNRQGFFSGETSTYQLFPSGSNDSDPFVVCIGYGQLNN